MTSYNLNLAAATTMTHKNESGTFFEWINYALWNIKAIHISVLHPILFTPPYSVSQGLLLSM